MSLGKDCRVKNRGADASPFGGTRRQTAPSCSPSIPDSGARFARRYPCLSPRTRETNVCLVSASIRCSPGHRGKEGIVLQSAS